MRWEKTGWDHGWYKQQERNWYRTGISWLSFLGFGKCYGFVCFLLCSPPFPRAKRHYLNSITVIHPTGRSHLWVRWSDITSEKLKTKVSRNYPWALILRVARTAPLLGLVRNNAWNCRSCWDSFWFCYLKSYFFCLGHPLLRPSGSGHYLPRTRDNPNE